MRTRLIDRVGLLGLLALVYLCGTGRADVVRAGGKGGAGTVVFATADAALLLTDDDQVREASAAELRAGKLSLPAGGRWALVRKGGQEPRLIRVTRWDGRAFTVTTNEGAAEQVAPAEGVEIVLFPVLAPKRMLPFIHVQQKPDFCGEAVVEMATTFLGSPLSQDRVNEAAGLGAARGVYGDELEHVLVTLGVATLGPVRHPCEGNRAFTADLVRLVRLIDEGRPTLIGIWNDPANKNNAASWACDHFVLLAGYDLERSVLYVRDPNQPEPREIKFGEFASYRQSKFNNVFDIAFRLYRTWHMADGTTLDAECVGADEASVRLRVRGAARERALPTAALAQADQAFLKPLLPLAARAFAAPLPSPSPTPTAGTQANGPLAAVLKRPMAQVVVRNAATWVTLAKGEKVYGPVDADDAARAWTDVPKELEGRTFSRLAMRHKSEEATLAFDITQAGVVLLIVPEFGGGGSGGDWQRECVSSERFRHDGWSKLSATIDGRALYWRQCKAGERFTYRIQKYHPLILVR